MLRYFHSKLSVIVAATLAVAGCFTFAIAERSSPPNDVVYIGHEEVSQAFAKGGTLIGGHSGQAEYRVVTARKNGPTDAESHDVETDVIYVVDGTATVVTGGTLVAPRTISPGELRGSSVEGGTSRSLSKGDVMIIPHWVPHWFKVPQPPFLYFIVKVH